MPHSLLYLLSQQINCEDTPCNTQFGDKHTVLFSPSMASFASCSSANVTNPKPRALPVSLSVTMMTKLKKYKSWHSPPINTCIKKHLNVTFKMGGLYQAPITLNKIAIRAVQIEHFVSSKTGPVQWDRGA